VFIDYSSAEIQNLQIVMCARLLLDGQIPSMPGLHDTSWRQAGLRAWDPG
jgi:hypothetical protein